MDIMSSPDPLNASLEGSALMSSRRVTRSQSQASSRLSSVNPSPRKQTFALDVGDQRSPQKILVTVEADDRDSRSSNVKRRLFQSPTQKRVIRRREKTTTTVVPLKGLTDDEDASSSAVAPTPKRRGRPPKSAGTPTTAPKKKATPIRKTPGRTRRTGASQPEDLTSDISVPDPDATPKPSRTRTSTKRKNGASANEAGETPKPKRRGRPRREPVTADEVTVGAARSRTVEPETEENSPSATSEDSASVTGSYASALPSSHGGDDEDIWMATLSDPPPQQLSRRGSPAEEQQSDAAEEDEVRLPSADREMETDDEVELQAEFGAAGSYSEAGSMASDARGNSVDKDTIMVQEEFTMISIHSLPSMQGKLGVSTSQYEVGEETSQMINQTLDSLRNSRTESRPKTPYEDQVSLIGPSPEPDENAVPTDNSLLVPSTSSAVTRPSPGRAKTQDLVRQLALKSLQSQQAPESPERQQHVEGEFSMQAAEEPSVYDDSFSEIPEAVLEAATPKPTRRAMSEVLDNSLSGMAEVVLDTETPRHSRQHPALPDEEGLEPNIQPSIERPLKDNPPNPQSDSNRLLTPDETPSPVPSEIDNDKLQSAMMERSGSEIQNLSPVPNISQREQSSILRSSRRDSSETAALQMSSSRSAPRIEVVEAEAQIIAPSEVAARPTLSPIVRAGRALQMVTSDPPSPPARSPSLGSPFRSSVSKSPAPSTAAAQQKSTTQPAFVTQTNSVSQPASVMQSNSTPRLTQAVAGTRDPLPAEVLRNSPWSSAFMPFKQIKNLVVQGAQVFSSPRTVPPSQAEDPVVTRAGDNIPQGREDTLSMHNSMFTLGGGPTEQVSRTSSVLVEAAHEDEMSWQAEDTPAPRMNEHPDFGSSTVRVRRGSDVGEISDVEMESLVEESYVEDEEDKRGREQTDDIWAIEAQRPTPGRPQPKDPETEPVLNPPRRSKLPSPWRQNSKRLVYNDELYKLATETADNDEELSLLSQFSGKEPETGGVHVAGQHKKVDLSAFFSSPALLPDVLPPGMSYPKPARHPSPRQAESRPSFPSGSKALADHQAREEPEREPRATPSVARRIFSFGGQADEPHSSLTEAPSLPSVPQKELRIGGQRRVDLFSPMEPAVTRAPEAVEPSSSPSTPPRQLFPHVPQKSNFTPRSGQAGNSLFAPVSREPPEILSEEEDEAEEADSSHRFSSSPTQESSFVAPVLKPLPGRAQSPTKSCIRSPLKPKTPGRVVEFTSSTLSPLAQAQARAEQPSSSASRPSVGGGDQGLNKENEPTTAAPTASKPPSWLTTSIPHLPPPSAATTSSGPRLSATTWTRSHWERLDSLLQQRRSSGALAFQLAHPVPKTSSTRPKLLGKQVVAQGETMTLEQWHLDVVDAFAAEIGRDGVWDERVLAKRVFALLVGEERRRLGKVDRSKRGAGEWTVL